MSEQACLQRSNRIDDQLIHRILQKLADASPQKVFIEFEEFEKEDLIHHLLYLEEYGLIKSGLVKLISGYRLGRSGITAKGLDYLTEDGGLGAALNTVTVRFEADTLRQILGNAVDQSDIPKDERSKIKSILATAGEEVLKSLVVKAVGAGVPLIPSLLEYLLKLPHK